ncbi:unnamed protein product [Bursaphelenchus okinawaensis]|uniref:Uncharacterized protein n=1 Tax=Bursaphelenchus okinawaensis TaxID=465554 RepID=A0A811KUJ8_9BILA|nr:unnamed protein product [Bursaphelenchus okinawaensis]CAG9112260.1 unnamed protein product [Bursaphelenchus okinawaensis]
MSNEDFVSSDVSAALQEAREFVTKGKRRVAQNEHIIEESTTVQVNKTGSRTDPVEVIISRSKKFTQDSSDDEYIAGSLSDSDLLPRERTLSSASRKSCKHYYNSDNELEGLRKNSTHKHTNVKYRKKRNEMWTKDNERLLTDGSDSEFDGDQARLEVDVKEECLEDDGEGHVVIKTWSARWTVQHYDLLPEWLQDNEYLRHGHRPPLPSVVECFKSILSVHTETGNIWTHLIGCVAFFFLALWFLTRPDTHIGLQEKVIFSFFFGGAILCLGLSFMFHTLSCHSLNVLLIFSKLDYMGISLLIVGSFIPWVYYGFYCRQEPKITYIAMISVLGVGAIVVSLWDKFSESRYRPLRAGVFVSMGLSGIIPAVHFVYTDGMSQMIDETGFYWLVAMAALYLFGAFLYATRTPERFFPGKCDLVFQSHQLFHLCVVVAAFTHYYGISEMAMKRLTSECPAETNIFEATKHTEL